MSDTVSPSDSSPDELVLLLTFLLITHHVLHFVQCVLRTALLCGQIGRRIFRQRLETGDKETALEERKVGGHLERRRAGGEGGERPSRREESGQTA